MVQTEPIKPVIEKIAHECEEAGASKWQALKIIKELSAEEKASEQKLKAKALAILQASNPEAAKVFESFAKMHVHTSRQFVEAFDRGNIVKSLLLETHANRTIAEKIGAEVEDKIKDLKIAHLTTALVREMANAKLLEYGFEDLHNRYARLGMPVADIEKELGNKLFENKQIMIEYSLRLAIPKDLAEAHFKADLQICAIEDFCTKPFGFSSAPQTAASSIEEFVPALLQQLNEKKAFFSAPLNIEALNYFLAKTLSGQGEQKTKKSALFAFDCLNAAFSGKKPTITMNLFVPERTDCEKVSGLKQKATDIANGIVSESKNSKEIVVAVDSKFCLKALEEKAFEKELTFLNCSKEEMQCIGKEVAFKDCCGALGKIGLNLEKIAIENAGKESEFEQEVAANIAVAKRLMGLKKSELQKRNYLKENKIEIEKLKPVLAVYGISCAAALFLEKGEFDKEASSFCEKTAKKISGICGEDFILSDFSGAETQRFAAFNEKEFMRAREGILKKCCAVPIKGFSQQSIATDRKSLEEAIDMGFQIIKLVPSRQ